MSLKEIKKFLSSPLFYFRRKKVWNRSDEYLYSQEFLDDVREAAERGAADQDRFMKSVGARWDRER